MNWSILKETAPELIAVYGMRLIVALAIFFVGKFIAKKGIAWVSNLMQARGIDATVCGFVANIAYVFALVMLAVAAVAQVGIPTTSFIAAIGAAGLAIGLALQGSLSNFASGVLLVTLKPCSVGDYIESNGMSGTVQEISLFSTLLMCGDGRAIVVPNSQLFSSPITNYSTTGIRRIEMLVNVGYESDVEHVKSILDNLVQAEDRILHDRPIQIGINAFDPSSVQVVARPWVNSADYVAVRFDLYEKIKVALEQADIPIASQRLTVKLHKESA